MADADKPRQRTVVHYNLEDGMTISRAATARIFDVKPHGALDATSTYVSSSALAHVAAQHLGRWWALSEAARAREALDEALRECAPLEVSSCTVEDLLHFVPPGASTKRIGADGFRAGKVLRRRTAFATGAGGAAQRDEWREDDTSQKPSALLLTHTFRDAPARGTTLTLRTLFLDDVLFEVPPETMVAQVFAGRAPALSARTLLTPGNNHYAPTTDVEVDGTSLTAEALATLPPAQRRCIAAARRAQLLHTVRACLGDARWPGGFLALRHLAEELAGGVAVRAWTEPLAAHICRARAGGKPTSQLMQCHELLAEAHTAAGRHAEAAALLRAACEAHERSGADERLLQHPAFTLYHLGNCEGRAGNYAAAISTYRRGLGALDAVYAHAAAAGHTLGPIYLKLRVQLPSAIVCAAYEGGMLHEVDEPLLRRMFGEHAGFAPAYAAAHAQGGNNMRVRASFTPDGAVTVTLHPTRVAFAMTNGRSGEWEIIELPCGAQAPPCVSQQRGDTSRSDRCIPPMAPARCAGCGATRAGGAGAAFKVCAACTLVHYCGAWRPPARSVLHDGLHAGCVRPLLTPAHAQAKSARWRTGRRTRRRARRRRRRERTRRRAEQTWRRCETASSLQQAALSARSRKAERPQVVLNNLPSWSVLQRCSAAPALRQRACSVCACRSARSRGARRDSRRRAAAKAIRIIAFSFSARALTFSRPHAAPCAPCPPRRPSWTWRRRCRPARRRRRRAPCRRR
jgi:hypothetical protein